MSLNKKFGLSDTEIELVRKESDEVQFYGNKVKDFNEEELRIAVGCLARILIYEQNKLLNVVTFAPLTLETVNYKLPERSALNVTNTARY